MVGSRFATFTNHPHKPGAVALAKPAPCHAGQLLPSMAGCKLARGRAGIAAPGRPRIRSGAGSRASGWANWEQLDPPAISVFAHSGDRFEVQRLMGEYARRPRCAVSCRISKPPAPPTCRRSEANYNAPSRPLVACLLLRTTDMRVDRINHLVPMLAGGDDLIGVGGPDEGPVVVDLGEKALDGGLEIDEPAKHAALQPAPVSLAKKPSMAGIEPRGRYQRIMERAARMAGAHLGMLVGGVLSRIAWISLPAGTAGSIRFRKPMDSWWRWRASTGQSPSVEDVGHRK
jgi:hypothetical protein